MKICIKLERCESKREVHTPNGKHSINLIILIPLEPQLLFHPTHIRICQVRTIQIIREIHQTAECQDEEICLQLALHHHEMRMSRCTNLSHQFAFPGVFVGVGDVLPDTFESHGDG